MNQAKDMVEANLKTGKLSTSFYKGNELAGTMERFDSISEPQLEKSYFCHMKDGLHPCGKLRIRCISRILLT